LTVEIVIYYFVSPGYIARKHFILRHVNVLEVVVF